MEFAKTRSQFGGKVRLSLSFSLKGDPMSYAILARVAGDDHP
jgi:hypothetical protein